MAESESGADKTEDPTEKRKKDSREKGEIARSKELNTLAIMLAGSIGLIIFVVFSQLESMVPLVMRGFFGDGTEIIFAWLLVANAAFALILQPIIDRASEKISYNALVLIGAVLFALSLQRFRKAIAQMA